MFLDIQMPKLTGFEMLELLEKQPVIIFSTAYDEFAIKAFEKNTADYLLKPYRQDRFDEAVDKARQRLTSSTGSTVVQRLIDEHHASVEVLDRIVIRSGNKIIILGLESIEYFEAQDDYVAIFSEGNKYLKQLRMKYLETALPGDLFVRVHRSYIVAIDQIDKIEAYTKDSYLAILKNGEKIPVSRLGVPNPERAPAFLNLSAPVKASLRNGWLCTGGLWITSSSVLGKPGFGIRMPNRPRQYILPVITNKHIFAKMLVHNDDR